jgi:hypothetical protein
MAGEQHGRLGVRPERARDQQLHAVGARRGRHPVERLRDVRTHALALA